MKCIWDGKLYLLYLNCNAKEIASLCTKILNKEIYILGNAILTVIIWRCNLTPYDLFSLKFSGLHLFSVCPYLMRTVHITCYVFTHSMKQHLYRSYSVFCPSMMLCSWEVCLWYNTAFPVVMQYYHPKTWTYFKVYI